jgi:hypothetical protein
MQLPNVGIVPLLDKETKETIWVNSSSPIFRNKVTSRFSQKRLELEKMCIQNGANYLFIETEEDYVPKLVRLFRVRNRARKKK